MLFAFFILPNWVSCQNCVWAKSGDGSYYNAGYSVCADQTGNIYYTGSFGGSTISFGTNTIINYGVANVFITKYDINGNVLWTRGGRGTGNDAAYSVSTDLDGNIYVTGGFSSPSLVFGTYTLTNIGNSDVFIVKYDPFGNVIWAKNEGTLNTDWAYSIKTDFNGNVYITGYTDNSSITFGTYTLSAPPYTMFLVKYDKNGNVKWANTPSGSAISYAVNTDNIGNVYTTGEIVDSIVSFGTHTVIRGNSYANCFVTKYDSLGNAIWAKSNTGRYGYGLTTNQFGETFVIGNYFANTITIGTNTFTNSNTANTTDVFLIKYDSNGNVVWAKSAGAFNNDYGYSVANDISSIYITGRFNTTINFGTIPLNAPSGSSDPMYIIRLDFNGNVTFQTALTSGGTFPNYQNSVCTDNFSNIYIASAFDSNPFNVGGNILNLTGGRNVFVAKYHFNNVGIKENGYAFSTSKLYPNPNIGVFNIEVVDKTTTQLEVSIFDITGKQIINETKTVNNSIINLDYDLLNGTYLIKLKLKDGSVDVHRLVITK